MVRILPPCDQIVERVNVWRKAENDPTDCAPKNNSVTHPHSPIDRALNHSSPVGLNSHRLSGRKVQIREQNTLDY